MSRPLSLRAARSVQRLATPRPSTPSKDTWVAVSSRRSFRSTSSCLSAPKSRDRGPTSKEDTQTDFQKMDIFTNTPPPTSSVDGCFDDGFSLNSGLKVVGSGMLLVGGEAFKWSPWLGQGRREGTIGKGGMGNDDKGVKSKGGKVLNAKGQLEIGEEGWGVLNVVWPKPDLLVLGTGARLAPVSPATRKLINDLGIRLEVQDTRNAAAQFNLLATERGVQQVAAALIPIGWREGS
ncbi:NADH dehydrogenase [Sphaceloma murrayae]|uniref:NADH dehydrogenase [ubiquinone] 1 alpha subcomplex assembly factor 3 n=1 Tax=Sphaceloma murrayae TaxID=2082308 RepID=A0A2K1QKL2_9PEZI|nr:NADH dehydrogenase [Sphaceloma murrayae]